MELTTVSQGAPEIFLKTEKVVSQKSDRVFSLLRTACKNIEDNNTREAESNLEKASDFLNSQNDLKSSIFLRALNRRLKRESVAQNLYLAPFENAQIDLFNILGEKVPLVSVPGQLSNHFLKQGLCGLEDALLLDIGMGTGKQMANLLEDLAKEPQCHLREIHIVGIEPSGESIRQAQNLFNELAPRLPFQLQFTPIEATVEEIKPKAWKMLRQLNANILINAAFALHHVSNKGGSQIFHKKNQVLTQLASLCPIRFVLVEPHSGHETSDLVSRFESSWKHFGLAFDYLDQIEISSFEADSIKTHFFGREVEDILAKDDESRSERHEYADAWLERIHDSGFTTLSPSVPQDLKNVRGLKTQAKENYFSLEVNGEQIVSVFVLTS